MPNRKSRRVIEMSWFDVEIAIDLIAKRIKSIIRKLEAPKKITTIYGIPRGGLVVAVILSHKLGLRLIQNKSEITVNTLVVDDISDSGETLRKYTMNGKFLSATLITLKDSKFKPSVTGGEYNSNSWIHYPWETKKSSKKDN